MKIQNIALVLLTSITVSSCSFFFDDENEAYSSSNDPLINRSEESLPLDKELKRITEDSNDALLAAEQRVEEKLIAEQQNTAINIEPVKIDTKNLNDELKSSLKQLNLNQAQMQRPASQNYDVRVTPKVIPAVNIPLATTEVQQAENQNAQPVISSQSENLVSENNSVPEPISGDAQVGQCYGKVKVAGKYKSVTEEVVVEPAKTKTEIIPAKYGYKTEEVVIKEESFKYVQIPARYKTIREEVVIEPEKKQIITIPAQYKAVTERVMVKPARKVWTKGRGLIEKPGEDGEIMCLKEEPAVYENVTKQVMVTPERTETRVIPAVKELIEKQVIDQPARIEKVAVPASKTNIQKKIVIEPEQTRNVEIPAIKKLVTKKVPISEDRIDWAPIVCNDNLRMGLVSQIQAALNAKGYNVKQDGNFGKETSLALDKFQKSLGYESSEIGRAHV